MSVEWKELPVLEILVSLVSGAVMIALSAPKVIAMIPLGGAVGFCILGLIRIKEANSFSEDADQDDEEDPDEEDE